MGERFSSSLKAEISRWTKVEDEQLSIRSGPLDCNRMVTAHSLDKNAKISMPCNNMKTLSKMETIF